MVQFCALSRNIKNFLQNKMMTHVTSRVTSYWRHHVRRKL